MILKPGIHYDVPANVYHGDPCETPSLSRSVAKVLLDQSPGHAAFIHPRLNKRYQAPHVDKFALGTVVHALVLGRGGEFELVDAKDWRTNAAKEARDNIAAKGKTPILVGQFEAAEDAAKSISGRLADFGMTLDGGKAEAVMIWDDPVAGLCRSMVDSISNPTVVDLKTTSVALSLETAARQCSQLAYEFQFAFYERGLQCLDVLGADLDYIILFVEINPPYAVLPVRLPNAAKALGRACVARACKIWAACKAANEWPLYRGEIPTVEYPPWAIAEWEGES